MNKQLTLGVCPPPAQAAYVVTLTQEGPNVVALGSGTINTTDLTFYYSRYTSAPFVATTAIWVAVLFVTTACLGAL
jgi:hypothetical protein